MTPDRPSPTPESDAALVEAMREALWVLWRSNAYWNQVAYINDAIPQALAAIRSTGHKIADPGIVAAGEVILRFFNPYQSNLDTVSDVQRAIDTLSAWLTGEGDE